MKRWVLIWCLACKGDKDGEDSSRFDSFLESRCRFLVDDECVTSQDRSCGNVVSYPSDEECLDGELMTFEECSDDVEAALATVEEELAECLSILATFNCASQDICTDGIAVYNAGACAEVNDILEVLCP